MKPRTMAGTASPEPAQPSCAENNSHSDNQNTETRNPSANGYNIEDSSSDNELTPPPPSPTPSPSPSPSLSPPAESDLELASSPPPTVNGRSTPPPRSHHDDSDDNDGDHQDSDDDRPAKRRKIAEPPTPSRRHKPDSPPWKKIEAEGPTTLIENGRRKSGRISTLQVELEPPPSSKRRPRGAAAPGLQPSPMPKKSAPSKSKTQPTRTSSRRSGVSASASASVTAEPAKPPPPTRARRPSPSPKTPAKHPTGTRRSSRQALKSSPDEAPSSQPRIRLRLRQAVIPVTHPDTIPRPRRAATFEEYWATAWSIPVEEGGLMASEDGPEFTDEMAKNEADLIIQIEHEAEPGGLLSEEKCSVFAPEPQEEPPRQWAHMDHLLKAVSNFRRLMVAEQQRHRATAKRLAEACRDEWTRRQPKSAEQLEAEAQELWVSRYKGVVKTLSGTWDNVRMEINRRRVEEWKISEEKRVKAALNKAVNMSEQKLQARQTQLGSDDEMETDVEEEEEYEDGDVELGTETEAFGEEPGEDDGRAMDNESNMSSSEDEAEEKGEDQSDEELTQEQLMKKYANLPSMELEAEEEKEGEKAEVAGGESSQGVEDDGGETSDESVDMDDDLGSSDEMSEEGSGEEEEEEGTEEEDNEPAGLLGFFGKSELKKLKEGEVEEGRNGEDGAHGESKGKPTNGDGPKTNGIVEIVDMNPEVGVDTELDEVDMIPVGEVEVTAESGAGAAANEADAETRTKAETGKTTSAPIPAQSPTTATKNLKNGTARASEPQVVEIEGEKSLANGHAPSPKINGHGTNGVIERGPTPDTPTVMVTSAPEPSEGDTKRSSSLSAEVKPTTEANDAAAIEDGPTDVTELSRSTSAQAGGPKTEIPFLLRGTLREYQHYGLDWLSGLYANKTNGILADEMGLGKTIQTIALLAHLACNHGVWGPHLVIVPTSVMLNWEMEFKKWCPGFKILSYYGSIEERRRKRQGWTNDDIWNVCITSYQLVLADQQVFKRRKWHYMILDEAHNIKNFKSQRWQTLLGFNTHSRLLLTGTPLQNNLTELWSLLFFLMPSENGVGGFADLREFQDWFHRPEAQILESGRDQMDDEARAIISKLHKVLRPYLLRRLKADVEKQMPAKYEHVEFCRLSKRQRELYDGFLARSETRDTLSSGNYLSIINCLMQLRKVCNHPDLFVDRPIMTSFRMHRSVPTEYETPYDFVGTLLRRDPMQMVSLGFLNLAPAEHEHLSISTTDVIAKLSSNERFNDMIQAQKARAAGGKTTFDPASVLSNISYLEGTGRWGRFEELQHCVYLNALRKQQKPVYGKRLIERLTIGIQEFPRKPRPKIPRQVMAWFEDESVALNSMVQTLDQRSDALNMTIQKFACVTPAVVTRDMTQVLLGRRGVEAFTEADLKLSAPVKYAPFIPAEPPLDPWHEARMRLSIQFPDKRLLQYDCGKLQALDRLLRRLQAGGHRALIFTQMTKVLDILETFLNIHGHKYLRLDGSTKIEQRQIMTDRFNHDPRILCFILSTRSGGLGINLTGADTVIFYDQDWNPAMDKQCQDRCHRIGQTRDVHIYRLVSEHTIEANILRKASQKQMLDDVVIQEGEFTTDYFNKITVEDVIQGGNLLGGDVAANEAMERMLEGAAERGRETGRVLEQAEDKEDVDAARLAEKEIRADEADFEIDGDAGGKSGEGTRQGTPGRGGTVDAQGEEQQEKGGAGDVEFNAWCVKMANIDVYMLGFMGKELEGTPLELPKDNRKKRRRDRKR